MDRREIIRLSAVLASGMVLPALVRASALSQKDALAGLREALQRGATAAVGSLGKTDGFLANDRVRIPLPTALDQASGLLRAAGQGKRMDELVTAMNRAAESAVPLAKPLLSNAIQSMSVSDAQKVLSGGDTSVTEFFAGKTRQPLSTHFLPIVRQSTDRLSLARKYNDLAGKASKFGLVKGEDADVAQYVTGKALDGLFFMIGEEERRIRRDPIGTGSAILKKVFSGL